MTRAPGPLVLWLRCAALAGAALAVTGIAWTALSGSRAAARFPAQGSFVEVQGTRLHLLDLGPQSDRAIVLLHGAFGNAGEWPGALLDRLVSAGQRVLIPDRPGHGWSQRPEPDLSLGSQARLLQAAIAAQGVQRITLCGFSYGGAVALAWALDQPSGVEALVLLNAPSHPWRSGYPASYDLLATPGIGPLCAQLTGGALATLLRDASVGKAFAPELVEAAYLERAALGLALRPRDLVHNARDIRRLEPDLESLVPRYGELSMPIVSLVSSADQVVSPTIHSLPLAAAVPQLERIEIRGAGHQLPWTRPLEVAERILAAVAGTEATSTGG
jgi:pimeloyl-ACP methyl ester carboxylesterase